MDTLATLRALVLARAKENPQMYGRLSRAAHILAVSEIKPHPEGGFAVHSENGDADYRVAGGTCTCADAKVYTCKHQLAVQLAAEIQRLQENTRQETRAPQRQVPSGIPGPRDPIGCPDHGERFSKPSRFGGLYCSAKLDNGQYCKWSSRKAEKAAA